MSDDDPTLNDQPLPLRFGRYEVRGLLGQGGFGRVYEGFDPELLRPVAIKVPRVRESAQTRERFLVEGRRLARLRHPGIVTLHDVGVEGGLCFLVSELVNGVDFDTWVRSAAQGWTEVVRAIAEVADALAYAHAQATVHRDVKPSNILMTAEGHPVLLDFGIAFSAGDEKGPEHRLAGTPGYMSPEQTEGSAESLDGRSDLFSLGVVLYEALSGRRPFNARNTHELWRQTREDDPPPLSQLAPDLPPELERTCLHALSKRAADRPATAADLATALRRVIEEAPTGGLSADHAPAEPVPPREVERRPVTVLACTFEAAGADPEEQLQLTVAFRQVCMEVATRHQATALPAGGPHLLYCFGFPRAFEDAARRAVRMALEVAAAARPLGPRLSTALTLHSSLALVGPAGSDGQLDMVGEARTVATRLEEAARPHAVTITAATRGLVSPFFECVPRGSFAVKGVAEPVELFEVVRAAPAHGPFEPSEPRALSPLVGREQEKGLLFDRWDQAAEGRGQAVLLTGEPGIGKSRLAHVLKERVGSADGAAVIEWRCSPYHENSSLYPVTEYLERTLSFTPALAATERLGRLQQFLAGQPEDAVPLFAALLSLGDGRAPLNLSPQRQKERTLEAILAWVGQRAQQQALLLIVEDLHWVDASTLDLVRRLAAQVEAERMLLVCTFRPEFSAALAPAAQATQIALHRLTRRQTADLISQKAGALPAGLVEQLAARTEGVPLFVEEFTRTVLESGLAQDAGDLSATTLARAIPATLHDLLLARLDRIASARELVWVAAALGREVAYDVLAAASGMDEARLDRELAKLVGAEVLYRRGGPRGSYLFKHALIQDAAYQSMAGARRQEVHRRIARVLQERFPALVEAQPELVAHHHTESGALQEAVDGWERAGARARERFAMPEAAAHFQRGLALLARLEETPGRDRQELRFQTQLAVALTTARGWAWPEVAGVHARARELCLRLGDGLALFHVAWGAWAWRLLRRELDTARALSDELLALAEARGDRGWRTEAHWAVGCTSLFRGDFTRGQVHFERAQELHDPQESRAHAAFTGQDCGATLGAHWGWLLWHLGRPGQALVQARGAVARAREMRHPFSEAFATYHLGCVLQHCGLAEETLAMAEATLAIGDAQGFAIWRGLGTLCRGAGLALAGRPQEGGELIRLGLAGFEATGAGLSATHYCCRLAEALLACGALAEAERAIEDGLAIAAASSERFAEAELHRLRGDLAARRGEDAAPHFREAIEVAQRQGARSWQLRATTSLCRLNGGKEARDLLTAALAGFTEGADTRDLIEARALLDELAR